MRSIEEAVIIYRGLLCYLLRLKTILQDLVLTKLLSCQERSKVLNKSMTKANLFSPNMPEEEELAHVLDGNAVNEQEIEVGRPDQLINRPKRIRHKRSAPETWVKNIRKKKEIQVRSICPIKVRLYRLNHQTTM